MKLPKLITLGLVLVLTSFTNTKKFKPVTLSARVIDKNLAHVSDRFYAYKFETSNGEYNLFLSDLKRSDPQLFAACLVDSFNWSGRHSEPMGIYYHRHPAYARY